MTSHFAYVELRITQSIFAIPLDLDSEVDLYFVSFNKSNN